MAPSDRPRARSITASDGSEAARPARIVIADDDRLARDLLAGMLRTAGHQVEAVEDGQEAIERVGQGGVDLVLLDVIMPRLGGLEACRLLKSMTTDTFLPVVLVTVKTDTASRVEGLRIGADDYVCKPFEEAELCARVSSMLRIKRLHEQVTQQKARFERLSVHDEMTGLYNYRFLHTRLGEEFKRAERYHEPFACVLVDIDQLRAINDVGGRNAGDAAIRRVAEGIKRCVREVDVVARYGGEEFLIVLPSTHFAGSVVVAERIWREVSGRPVEIEGVAPGSADRFGSVAPGVADRLGSASPGARPDSDRRASPSTRAPSPFDPSGNGPETDPRWSPGARLLSVSIGVALYPSRDVRSKDALIRAAEAALGQAKREGGNRICVFQQQGYIYTPAVTAAARPGDSGTTGAARQDPPASSRGDRLDRNEARNEGRNRPMIAESWRPAPESEGGRKLT